MENYDIVRGCVAVTCCAMNLFLPARAGAADPNAADLVRAVRKGEMWLHDVDSLHIRVRRRWVTSPETVAEQRAKIQAEFGVQNPDVKRYPDLREVYDVNLEFAVDRKRVRYCEDDPGDYRIENVWDGRELRLHAKYYSSSQESYYLNNMIPPRTFPELFPCNYGWPRSQPHSFWYDERDVNGLANHYGRTERFRLTDCRVYRGTPCYVLECRVPPPDVEDLTWRWFVGQLDGLLYGIQTVWENQVGGEHWWSDYREVVPGGWFPRRSNWASHGLDEAARTRIEAVCTQEVIEFHLNEPLAGSLFTFPIEPGVNVTDDRGLSPRRYKPWPSLLGKGTPGLAGIDLPSPPAAGRPLLIAFVDLDQRPSRSVLKELAASGRASLRERVDVVPIQAGQATAEQLDGWRKTLSLPWPIGVVTDDPHAVRWTWGAKSLPWLILTDENYRVVAEGFAVDELNARIEDRAGGI